LSHRFCPYAEGRGNWAKRLTWRFNGLSSKRGKEILCDDGAPKKLEVARTFEFCKAQVCKRTVAQASLATFSSKKKAGLAFEMGWVKRPSRSRQGVPTQRKPGKTILGMEFSKIVRLVLCKQGLGEENLSPPYRRTALKKQLSRFYSKGRVSLQTQIEGPGQKEPENDEDDCSIKKASLRWGGKIARGCGGRVIWEFRKDKIGVYGSGSKRQFRTTPKVGFLMRETGQLFIPREHGPDSEKGG